MKKKCFVIAKNGYYTTVLCGDNKPRELDTLAGKARRYADDLAVGYRYDSKSDSAVKLTDTQLAFRSGYLKARSDSAKLFKRENPDYTRSPKINKSYHRAEAQNDLYSALYFEYDSVQKMRDYLVTNKASKIEISKLDKRLSTLDAKINKLLKLNDNVIVGEDPSFNARNLQRKYNFDFANGKIKAKSRKR